MPETHTGFWGLTLHLCIPGLWLQRATRMVGFHTELYAVLVCNAALNVGNSGLAWIQKGEKKMLPSLPTSHLSSVSLPGVGVGPGGCWVTSPLGTFTSARQGQGRLVSVMETEQCCYETLGPHPPWASAPVLTACFALWSGPRDSMGA